MSYYGSLEKLLNAVGATLKPKTFCVAQLADQGAGHPDFGLYTAKQVPKGQPKDGQTPERGVVEVKSASDAARLLCPRRALSGRGHRRPRPVACCRALSVGGGTRGTI